MIETFVPGRAAPQGSKRYLGNGIMVESSKFLAPWRADVRAALVDEAGQPGEHFAGAVVVRLVFVMPRPAGTPKRHTPPATKRPDIDKLARAVLDAVTSAGVWDDDSQVIELVARKRLADLGETPGCWITVDVPRPEQATVDLDAAVGLFEVTR